MISTKSPTTIVRILCELGTLCIAVSLTTAAQVQTSKSTTEAEATQAVTIQRGEIVSINGNSVILKMDDGLLREFDNVPESVTFMVDGKPVNIKNAKVGMKLEKQTVVTTTPRVVTTVETVTGTVFHVAPPSSLILRLENGENQQFKIPQGQKFTINGQVTDAWGLRKGMKVSAQRVTEVPETIVAHEIQRTGSVPPPPPAPKPDEPILIVMMTRPTQSPEAAPQKLPTTASNVPLIGLLGLVLCGFSLIVITTRIAAARLRDLKN